MVSKNSFENYGLTPNKDSTSSSKNNNYFDGPIEAVERKRASTQKKMMSKVSEKY